MATTTVTTTATTTTVSNEQAPVRLISKHAPVPFLLEAFPVPPSHIPPSPAVSPSSINPPPSLPPSAPLPPVPGPSPLNECDTLLLVTRRPSSKLSISSSSSDPQSPIRTRTRNGSLSSLRSFHSATRNHSYDFANTISEEGPYDVPNIIPASLSSTRDIPDVLKPSFPPLDDSLACIDLDALKSDRDAEDPIFSFPSPPSFPPPQNKHLRKSSRASELAFPSELDRSVSPDVSAIIQATSRPRSRPRPRVSSQPRSRVSNLTNEQSRSRAGSLNGNRSSGSSKPFLSKPSKDPRELEVEVEHEDGHDSDSSIDLHTPLPHLMLRHGLLSPHSKLLPTSPPDPSRLSIASNFSQTSLQSNFSAFSNQSDASLVTNSSTGSKHPKDSRDTPSRRVRHRDGRLLRGGIGLTTGLGWSDSEDEDAPSPLTRRLSALNLSRRSSATSISTSHSHSSLRSPHPLSRSISHSILREEVEVDDVDEFGRVARASESRRIAGRAASGSKSLPLGGNRNAPPNGRTPKTRTSKPKDEVRCSFEDGDGVTPTRAEFRDSAGSSSSGIGPGIGNGNSSSTASTSSLSLPFPATPQSPVAFSAVPNPLLGSSSISNTGSYIPNPSIPSRSPTPSLCNVDKSLPPLPLTPQKYPPSLKRLRTYSSASSIGSVELSSAGLNGAGEGLGIGRPSLGGVPRPSLGGVPKPSLSGVPRPSLGGVPRPSLNGTPRPSLSLGGVPRPSLSTPRPSIGTPRPSINTQTHPYPSASNSSLSTPNPSISSLTAQTGHTNGNGRVSSVPFITRNFSSPTQSAHPLTLPLTRPLKLLQPGEQPPRTGGVLMYNRNVHDQLKRTQSHSQSPPHTQIHPQSPSQPQSPISISVTQALVMPSERPKSRTGTGMVYRSSSGPGGIGGSRMRVPSVVRPSGVGVAL